MANLIEKLRAHPRCVHGDYCEYHDSTLLPALLALCEKQHRALLDTASTFRRMNASTAVHGRDCFDDDLHECWRLAEEANKYLQRGGRAMTERVTPEQLRTRIKQLERGYDELRTTSNRKIEALERVLREARESQRIICPRCAEEEGAP